MGGATARPPENAAIFPSFNPRARGGRDFLRLTRRGQCYGFNPRARGGRDCSGIYGYDFREVVSIHAPVGGATLFVENAVQIERVSIHAPVGGATLEVERISDLLPGFNPRARGGRDLTIACSNMIPTRFNPRARGGRDCCQRSERCRNRVSIHAPVGGATKDGETVTPKDGVSIHAPVGGATIPAPTRFFGDLPFQSTRPWGARRCRFRISLMGMSFNPRARGGRDRRVLSYRQRYLVSIHAPVGGATRLPALYWLYTICFNPRARGGRDRLFDAQIRRYDVSIHAPVGGATART